MSATSAGAEAEVVTQRRGRAGFILLDRPKALNALTLPMVRAIAAALDAWERDDSVAQVVVMGAGERAFCAGGDIRRLYEQGRAGDHAAQLTFWREEYQLNRRIKRYRKPCVALIDGIVMGGGVGVSAYASLRVAGDRYRFAMPEVGIGFFPDVGATWLLPRIPRNFGRYLALTGASIGAGDALAAGLADAFVASADMPKLAQALETESAADAVRRFGCPAPPAKIIGEGDGVAAWFAIEDRAAILAALETAEREGISLAAASRAAMRSASPTSQEIALRQMAIGGGLDFDEAMRIEFRVVSRICRAADFYEGVRATIVDKDNRPRWQALPEDPTRLRNEIDRYFEPLGAEELDFAGETA